MAVFTSSARAHGGDAAAGELASGQAAPTPLKRLRRPDRLWGAGSSDLARAETSARELVASSFARAGDTQRNRPRISVVVPAYNEAGRLRQTLPRLLSHGHLRPGKVAELIVVDDGSGDETADVAQHHLHDLEHARVLRLPWHAGKGAAVRLGVSAARGETILFMDADLATDLQVVPKVLESLADTDVVVGSRATPGAVVRGRSALRAALHHAFSRHARRFTGVKVSDPQCGLKAFRADVAKILFHLARTDGFGFDVEILLLADKLGFSVKEVPVDWTAIDGSKVRVVRDPAAMALDVTKARLRHGRRPPPVTSGGDGG